MVSQGPKLSGRVAVLVAEFAAIWKLSSKNKCSNRTLSCLLATFAFEQIENSFAQAANLRFPPNVLFAIIY